MSFLSVLKHYTARILDIIYPPFCVFCGRRESWWCEDCRLSVDLLLKDPCSRCLGDHSSPQSKICEGDYPFSGVVCTGYYHSKPLQAMITHLKYQGVTASRREVESYLKQYALKREKEFPWKKERKITIVPMPLAESRKRERGFNQAYWIGERLRHALLPQAEHIQLLERAPTAIPQATIQDPEIRKANVRGGFVCTKAVDGAVILVDDVITTGATAREAVRALKEQGVTHVYIFALALGK